MRKLMSYKIDIYTHILPSKYKELLFKKARYCSYVALGNAMPTLSDLDIRFNCMDKYEGLTQVLTVGSPPLEYVVDPKTAVELAKVANDEMAELAAKYPDRFVAAVACLPMNDIDGALKEIDRTIKELNFKGIQIWSPINGKPLDRPEFMEIYRKLAEYDLPIWIHPAKDSDIPDYPDEEKSKYMLYRTFGWPYETTLAMSRLVFGGVLEQYPDLKFVTHHCGGMIPFFAERLALRQVEESESGTRLTRPPLDYFRKFYADTSVSGSTPALMCGYAFFGGNNIVFGSDYPYGKGTGEERMKRTIESVEAMTMPQSDKEKIFTTNAEKILHLQK